MQRINIVGLSFLLGSSVVLADTTPPVPSSGETIIASDRSTYMLDGKKLHIPYVVLDDENSTTYSADMTLGDIDEEGNLIFF
jgi:hypothetical protein